MSECACLGTFQFSGRQNSAEVLASSGQKTRDMVAAWRNGSAGLVVGTHCLCGPIEKTWSLDVDNWRMTVLSPGRTPVTVVPPIDLAGEVPPAMLQILRQL